MTKQETLIIKSIINSFKSAITKDWTSGDVQKWSEWANSMRSSIYHNTSVLVTLISSNFQGDNSETEKIESSEENDQPINTQNDSDKKIWN